MDGASEAPLVLILPALLTGLLVIWVVFKRKSHPRNLPPGPPSVPFLGSMPFIGLFGVKHIMPVYSRLANTYGTVFHFWLGNRLIIVLNSYEVIHEALIGNALAMAGRPFVPFPGYNVHNLGIVHPTYSPKWKHDRSLSLSILKEFGFGKDLMEQRTLTEVEAMLDHLRNHTDVDFDPTHVVEVSVSNVITSICLGKSFAYDNTEFQDKLTKLGKFFLLYNKMVTNLAFMRVMNLLPSVQQIAKTCNEINNELLDFLKGFIREHTRCRVQGEQSDFIYAYLDRTGKMADEDSLLWIIRDLFYAGTETTSTTLRWAFLYMANYQDVQKKVQGELESVLSNRRLPSLQDKVHLPYTEAVIQEIQRISAVAPGTLPHLATEDTTIAGYLIPKDTTVHCNLLAVLRDPTIWPEPDKLIPERFLTEDGEPRQRPEFIPFSLGRRSCLGEIMAKQKIFLFFAAVLHNYNICRPEGVDQIDETAQFRFTRVPTQHNLIFTKRR